MIWILTSVFEQREKLEQSVPATLLAIEGARYVFVDGKYSEFPADHNESQDGTRQFCSKWGEMVVWPGPENVKRNYGLRQIDIRATAGDWVLWLDADEEMTEMTLPTTQVGTIDFVRESDASVYRRARLFRWSTGLAFRDRHYSLFDQSGKQLATLERALVPSEPVGKGLHHDVVDPDRQAAKDIYYAWLSRYEKQFVRQ